MKGGCYFFTVNLAERKQTLLTEKIELLRESFSIVKDRYPFSIEAIVSKRSIFRVIPTPQPTMSEFPIDIILGITNGINRKQDRSRFLAKARRAMASVWLVPSKLLPPASAAYPPVELLEAQIFDRLRTG